MRNADAGRWGYRLGATVLVLFMLFPLLVVVGTSFSASGQLQFPPKQLTLKWYAEFFGDERWVQAFVNSLIIATGTTALSTTVGVAAALGLRNASDRVQRLLVPVILVPMLVPAVVMGVTLLMYLSRFDLQQSYLGVIFAHSLVSTPFVFFIMQAVLSRFDWHLREAALDLGAHPVRVFFEIVLPGISHGVLASALIAFILSLQEFIVALFLTGYGTRTVPVLTWNALRSYVNPLITVVSTLLILAVIVIIVPTAIAIGLRQLARNL